MTMQMITDLCGHEGLKNSNLTTTRKIEVIKTTFDQHPHILFDKKTGRYHINPGNYSEKYFEITGGLAVNLVGCNGWTLLMEAAAAGELEIMKWLIEEQGANINLQDQIILVDGAQTETIAYFGDFHNIGIHAGEYQFLRKLPTPLYTAIHYGQIAAVKMLIQYGAVLLKNDKEKTCFEQYDGDRYGERDKSRSQKNIKTILHILETHSKYQAFIKTTLFAIDPTDSEKASSLDFTRLLKATQKIINRLQKKLDIPTDCKIKILNFLYGTGDFDKYQGVSKHIQSILAPVDPTIASSTPVPALTFTDSATSKIPSNA